MIDISSRVLNEKKIMWWTIFIWHFIAGFMGFCYKQFAISFAEFLFPDEEGLSIGIRDQLQPFPQWIMFLGSLTLGYVMIIAILIDAVIKPVWKVLFNRKKLW